MRSYNWNVLRWFRSFSYRSLDRAYQASKRLKSLRTKLFKQTKPFPLGESLPIVETFTDRDLHKSKFRIYWSLLECRLSLLVLKFERFLEFFLEMKHSGSSSLVQAHTIKDFFAEDYPDLSSYRSSNTLNTRSLILGFKKNHSKGKSTGEEQKRLAFFRKDETEKSYASLKKRFVCDQSTSSQEMNRKLAWIEATLNDSDPRVKRFYTDRPSFRTNREPTKEPSGYDRFSSTMAYESISLVPRSLTRTLSRFKAELTSQSNFSVLNDFVLAKNQSLASIRYIGYLLLFPSAISISLKNSFIEPQIRGWWNVYQPQLFINSFQEERALNRLRKTESLLWLNDATGISIDTQFWNYDTNAYNETIRLAVMYNEANIQLLLQLVTDTISIIISVLLLITGRKRLAVPNPWIQELFYSLNDTMKAFSILLLTDPCVGFHSPHGWELSVGSSFEHFGLAPNKYAISRFVSTFPVISDTVFKYRIFRHLNRTSPSIVATHHTMSE
uniref:Potassium/proton antiporter CemA n=1 Tax=Azolla mexicana TaxID=336973 RepID=A0A291R6D2_9MONI|nr:chloroplast envelope membrane protein [Azolla mexicana]